MARGWESKSVEDQQAEANSRPDAAKPRLTPVQVQRQHMRDGLLLTRKSVLAQLAKVENDGRRLALEAALADLDGQLAGLGLDPNG